MGLLSVEVEDTWTVEGVITQRLTDGLSMAYGGAVTALGIRPTHAAPRLGSVYR